MRKHLINLFLLFLVGAAAALVWVETRDAPPEPLIATPTSDIQRTGFMREDGLRVMLERRSDGWWLNEPVVAPVDPAEANRLLGVAEAGIGERFPLSAVDAAELGLAEPKYRLRFDDAEIIVGGLNPVTRQRYLQREDTVLQVKDPAGLPPPSTHAQLVHKALLAGTESPLIAVRMGERTLRREDGQWPAHHPDQEIATETAAAAGEAWASLRAMWTRAIDQGEAADEQAVELELGDGSRIALVAERGQQLLLRRPDYAVQYHVARNKVPLLLDFDDSAAEPGSDDEAQASEPVMSPTK